MLGAICGDIIGSVYEVNNIKQKKFKLFNTDSRYTDDTVMTVAISKACCEYTKKRNKELFRNNCIKYMKQFGRSHINAGYGGKFIYWLQKYMFNIDYEPSIIEVRNAWIEQHSGEL